MADTTELDTLVKAYRQGAETVRFADRSVTYRSRAEMAVIIAELAAALGVANPLMPVTGRNRIGLATHVRG